MPYDFTLGGDLPGGEGPDVGPGTAFGWGGAGGAGGPDLTQFGYPSSDPSGGFSFGDALSGLRNRIAGFTPGLGSVGNVASLGALGLGSYATIMNSLRAAQQARQMDQYNKQLQGYNVGQLGLEQQQITQNRAVQQQQLQQAQANAAQQAAIQAKLTGLADQPAPALDVNAFYQPMSNAEHAALLRAIRGDLTARDIPLDSSYATNLIAEAMAKTETGRLQSARTAALQEQGIQLGARGQTGELYARALPGGPQWPYLTQGFTQPAQPAASPMIPNVNVAGPLSYLAYMQGLRTLPRTGEAGTQTVGPIGNYQLTNPWDQYGQ